MPYKWAIELEYNGQFFSGSQIQCLQNTERINDSNVRTVQGELEKVLSTLIRKETKTIFSGRTDAGVHSLGQVVHFETQDELDLSKFQYSMNAILPKDISVRTIKKVSADFHAQKSARWRWYRYVINNRTYRSVWDTPSLSVRKQLNIETINSCLKYLIGKHDFSSFRCSKTGNPAKICNIIYANASEKNGIINIDIAADRFLYNMVRIIVGTVLEIEQNSLLPSKIKEILDLKDRTQAGATAVPDGLYLMKVGYAGEDFQIIENL